MLKKKIPVPPLDIFMVAEASHRKKLLWVSVYLDPVDSRAISPEEALIERM